MPETKKCPFCGEEINIKAIKCKHCHEWLNNDDNEDEEKCENEDFKNNLKLIGSFLVAILALIAGIIMYLDSKNPGSVNDFLNNKFEFNNKNLSNSQNDNENNSKENATNKITKSDYIGEWFQSARSSFSIEEHGNKIWIKGGGSMSADEYENFVFNCDYIEDGRYLYCKNGVTTRHYYCQGDETDSLSEFYSECKATYPKMEEEIVKKIYSDAKLVIRKGNPSDCASEGMYEKGIILNFYDSRYSKEEASCYAKFYEYSKRLEWVDKYQAKYFDIIKNGDISNLETIKKHNKAMNTLFDEFKNQFSNRGNEFSYFSDYLEKLEKIDEHYVDKSLTVKEYNIAVDNLLNRVYEEIKILIPEEDFKQLKQSEINYVKNTETFIKNYKQTPNYNENIAEYYWCNMRRFRILLLLSYFD